MSGALPDIGALRAIAAAAGARAMAKWRGVFARGHKEDGSPISEVDHDVDHFLRAKLSALDPAAGWLSEETADTAERLLTARLWVVDPIDGTRDFIGGRPGWAVSIAYVEGGCVTMAVLDAPARGEIWWAVRGGGAFRNGVQLACAHRTDLRGARVPADQLPPRDADLVMVPKPNSIALRMAMIAAGEADLVASIRWGFEWDLAAAALIAQEAGATVTDARGHPLRFNSTKGEAFGVLASCPGIHAAAVDRLASYAAERIKR